MTDRQRLRLSVDTLSRPLTIGAVAVKGEMACLNTSTGKFDVGQASTTLLPMGYFIESVTGDGTTETVIRLFAPTWLDYFVNDSGTPVAATDIGNECYILDGKTVSMSSAGSTRSKAGRVLDVSSSKGVGVQAGTAVTGPTGGAGGAAITSGVADRAAVKAIAAASRFDGMLVLVRSDGAFFRFVAGSTAVVDGANELVMAPDAGTGRWFRADKTAVLKLPIAFGLTDGATILTVPTGLALKLVAEPFWEVTTGWTGGTASTIGVASSQAGYNTAGDLLGGAAGDATATLGTAGVKPGTIGVKLDTLAERQAFVLNAADTLTYEEITSAYTVGAGFVCLPVAIMTTA